jgi:hypothetical protein
VANGGDGTSKTDWTVDGPKNASRHLEGTSHLKYCDGRLNGFAMTVANCHFLMATHRSQKPRNITRSDPERASESGNLRIGLWPSFPAGGCPADFDL